MRRRLLYIPGYAPATPERHRRLFAREAARFDRLWGVETEVSDVAPGPADACVATFRATTRMGDAAVETVVEVLRWDDLVAADFRTPLIAKLGHGLVALGDAVASGTLWRVARAAPWFAVAWIYPYLGLLVCLALGTAAGVFVTNLLGDPADDVVGWAVGAITALGALEAMRRTPLFVVHLLDDWIAQRRYLRRSDPALDARIAGFAARLAAAVAEGGADEVLVVGHSSGSILAIDMVARAYEADAELGRKGPAVSLLTLGGAELLIALHPRAGWFRDRIARLTAERSLFWAEVAGRWDALNFPERSPAAELGAVVDAESPNPRFRRVALRRMLTEKTIRRLMWRLKVFRVHFQYVMANELRAPYDFFALACGATGARAQFGRVKGEAMDPFPRRARSSVTNVLEA